MCLKTRAQLWPVTSTPGVFVCLDSTECEILVASPGIEPVSPTVEVQDPNNCTSREVPPLLLIPGQTPPPPPLPSQTQTLLPPQLLWLLLLPPLDSIMKGTGSPSPHSCRSSAPTAGEGFVMGRRVRCPSLHQLRGIFGMTWPGRSRSRMWTEEWYSAFYKLEVGQWPTEPSGCDPVGDLAPYGPFCWDGSIPSCLG